MGQYRGWLIALMEYLNMNLFQESYKGKKYIICDPTFINANAGMCMPEFKKVNPEIIHL